VKTADRQFVAKLTGGRTRRCSRAGRLRKVLVTRRWPLEQPAVLAS